MRMEIVPENIFERLALASRLVPQPIISAYWGMAISRCLLVAVRLGVFDALAEGPRTAAEVATATGCDPMGMETLLNALNGFGYLRRKTGRYRLTPVSKKWLPRSSSSSMQDALLFMFDIWEGLGGMEDCLRTGQTGIFHDLNKPAEFWSRYLRALAIFAKYVGKEIAGKVKPASPPQRLLDVGGGHGLYSVAFCKKFSTLQAEVLDLPPACGEGRQLVEEAGYSERVSFREGDFIQADWGEGYDLVLLFNIIHTVPVPAGRKLIAQAFQSLRPGGKVVILDSEHPGSQGDLSAAAGFNELFFFLINGTRVYPERQIREWLEQAGFSRLQKKRLLRMPMTLFLAGQK